MSSFMHSRPDPDEQLDVIADEARRRLLLALRDRRPQVDAPIEIIEWVNETDSMKSMTTMRHTHLPKLEAQGLIRWGRETGQVSQGPQFAEIEPLLTLLDDHRDELPDDRM